MHKLIGLHLSPLLKASWQSAVLILLILAVQWIFALRLNPRWRYGLWMLVVIRLALPWTVPSPVSLFNVLSFREFVTSLAGGQSNSGASGGAWSQPANVVSTDQPNDVAAIHHGRWSRLGGGASWLLWVWLTGVLGLALVPLITHWRLSKKIGRQRPLIDAAVMNVLEDCKQQMGVRVPVMLIETIAVDSPTLFGFVRPRLLLPAGLARSFSLEELRYVFLHELAHIKRHDIPVGWLMTVLQLLHWFNPFVWLASYRMRVDRELACDALALSYGREEEHQRYGRTIIKLLEGFGRPAWMPGMAGAVGNKKCMKERIRMIAKFKKTKRGFGLAAALFAGIGLITLTDAQADTSQPGKDLIGTWVLVGEPGNIGAVPAAGGRVKLITDRSWSVTQTDPESENTIYHHGGTWALQGNEYSETVDYADAVTKNLIKKTFKFTIKIENDQLTLTGIGNPWKEVWKRVKTDSLKPLKTETTSLQGTWHGKELGSGSTGTVSLVVRGSNLEFRGANTNEWYHATFSIFDSAPKQLVAKITDCASSDYVGTTACAIFRLQDGTLTLTGNEPGYPIAPGSFEAPGTRTMVFKRD
ncbi:MAG TPA: M56 family metallopeptidase [Verrucomicrobiae bacterium]|jgi:beta-lactamase regulating signal transducer with metallopeptidase domain|nr:M56 family metallopeptidase [Verrucomicrobiae bacterium]